MYARMSCGVCVAALLLAGATSVQAQVRDSVRDTMRYVLPRLEVTAPRERAAPPPVPVLTIRPAELQRTQSANTFDLIRRVAGIEVHEQGQGPGFASDVVIRGFTSDHSADVLLVIDGVPVNLPINGHGEGYADWNVLLPAAISSSRVLYGTASPLYGDFALGGVVEVFTGADASGTTYALSGSHHGDAGATVRTGRSSDAGGGQVALDVRRQQGWRDNSNYLLGNALLRGWKALGNARIEGGLSAYATRWNSPGFISIAQYNAHQLEDAIDETDGGDVLRLVGHGRYAAALGPRGGLQLSGWLLWSDWELFLNLPEAPDHPVEQVGERDRRTGGGAQAEYTHTLERGEVTFGLSARADGARYWIGQTAARNRIADRESLSARYQQGALYARWRRQFGERLGVDVGARADLVRHAARDRLLAGAAWQDATASVVSPKLGARYQLGRNIALRGSFSRGFRSAVGVIGDPARPPILAWSSDLGVQFTNEHFDVQAALFRMDVDNERRLDPVTLAISSAGSSVRQGVDLRASWLPVERLELRGAFTYNHARLTGAYADAHDDHNQESALVPAASVAYAAAAAMHPIVDEGEEVPGVARYFGSLGADLRLGSIHVNADFRLNGPYVPIGEPDAHTQSYTLLDLGVNVALRAGTSFSLALHNAFDVRYPELRASGFINPGAPRTLRATLRFEPADTTF
jgi:outer membrane receptor protein involved in Fe transport